MKDRGKEPVAHFGGELGRKKRILCRKYVARYSGELDRGPLSQQGMVTKDTTQKEKPEEKAMKESLGSACNPRSRLDRPRSQ